MSEMKLRPPKNRASAVQQHGPQVVRVSLREFKGAQARVPVLLEPGFPKDIMANYTTTLQDGVRPDANFDDARAVGAAAAPQRGAQVEADGSRSEPQAVSDGGLPLPQNLGPDNELLEDAAPRLVNALRELVVMYRQEGLVARRHEIRRIRQARLFWQGLQYSWWNAQDMNWHLPWEAKIYDDSALEEMPRYQFVTNLYQAFGLSFVSVISQDVPATRFYPQSTLIEADVTTAKAASEACQADRAE